jgi:hypothetical protein
MPGKAIAIPKCPVGFSESRSGYGRSDQNPSLSRIPFVGGTHLCAGSTTMASKADDDGEQDKPRAIHLTIPPRLYQVPLIGLSLGCAIGIMRGGRAASLRFLAENAHRPPTTVQGWYFYKKTKNYKVMLGGLKGAAKEGGRLGAISLLFVGIEEGMERLGVPWNGLSEIAAGTGTAGVFAAICKLVKYFYLNRRLKKENPRSQFMEAHRSDGNSHGLYPKRTQVSQGAYR